MDPPARSFGPPRLLQSLLYQDDYFSNIFLSLYGNIVLSIFFIQQIFLSNPFFYIFLDMFVKYKTAQQELQTYRKTLLYLLLNSHSNAADISMSLMSRPLLRQHSKS